MQRRLFCGLLGAAAFGQGAGARMVVLIGAPGSGKTTMAKMLAAETKMTLIDAAAVAEVNKSTLARRRNPGLASMDLVEDPGMNQLMRAEIERAGTAKGIILDGYPATKFQADYLTALYREGRLPRTIVIQLDVPDEVVRQRLKGLAGDAAIEQRIKDYRRELDNAALYYPEAKVVRVNSNRKPEETFADVRKAIAGN